MSEAELPGDLNKLKITPVLPHILNMTSGGGGDSQRNPFCLWNGASDGDGDGGNTETSQTHQVIRPTNKSTVQNYKIPPPRMRRSSESVLDDYRLASAKTAAAAAVGVHKNTFKKSPISSGGGGGGRKLILREPILRALQNCFPAKICARRKLLLGSNNDTAALESNQRSTSSFNMQAAQTSKKKNKDLRIGGGGGGAGISDFKDLINECQQLLQDNVDFSTRLNEAHKSKKFTTLRQPNANIQGRKHLIAAEQNKEAEPNAGGGGGSAGILFSTNSILLPAAARSNFPVLPDQSMLTVTTRTNSSTSCSQQAGNGVANNDDVTINVNDLAGYFETMVYIPKKMSSMAEMMYT